MLVSDPICGNTAVHAAAWNGCSQTLNLLVCNEADVNVLNKTGCTALHLAAQKGHNQCARVLLYAGCSPDVKNNNGDTALHHAAKFGHAGIIRILLSANCKVNIQNKVGETALHIALTHLHQKVAILLIEEGINYKAKNKKGNTALDIAKRLNNKELILLISSQKKGRFLSLMKRKIVSGDLKAAAKHHSNDLSDTGIGLVCGRVLHDRTHSPEPVSSTTSGVAPSAQYSCDLGPLNLPDENTSISSPEPTDFIDELARDFHDVRVNNSDYHKTKFVRGMQPAQLLAGFYRYRHCIKSDDKKTDAPPLKKVKPVKGLVDNYLVQPGVQYYKDLAGKVKKGPVGYAPLTSRETELSPVRNASYDNFYETFGTSPCGGLDRHCQRQRSMRVTDHLEIQQLQPLEHLNGDWDLDRREFVNRWHEHINQKVEYLDQENTPIQSQRCAGNSNLKYCERKISKRSKHGTKKDVYGPEMRRHMDSNASREQNERQVYGLNGVGHRTRGSVHRDEFDYLMQPTGTSYLMRDEFDYLMQPTGTSNLMSDYHTRSTMPIRNVSKRSSNCYLQTNTSNNRQSPDNFYDSDAEAPTKQKLSQAVRNKLVVRKNQLHQKEYASPHQQCSTYVNEVYHHMDRYESRMPSKDYFNDLSMRRLTLHRTQSDCTLSTYSPQQNKDRSAKLNRRPVVSKSRLRNVKPVKSKRAVGSYWIASPISPFDDDNKREDDSTLHEFNKFPAHPSVAKKMRPFWELEVPNRMLPGEPYHSIPQDSSTPLTCREKTAAGNSSSLLDTLKSDDSPESQLPAAPAGSPVSDGLTTMSLPPPEALLSPSPPGGQPTRIPSEQLHSMADCGSNPDSGYDGSKIYRSSATPALNRCLQMSYMDLIGVEATSKEVPLVSVSVNEEGALADPLKKELPCYMPNTTVERALFSPVRGSSSNVAQISVSSNSGKEHWSFRRIDLRLNDDVEAKLNSSSSSHVFGKSNEMPSKSVDNSDLGDAIMKTDGETLLNCAFEGSAPKHITTPVMQRSTFDAGVQCSSIFDAVNAGNPHCCDSFDDKFAYNKMSLMKCSNVEVSCIDKAVVVNPNNSSTLPSSANRSKEKIALSGIGRSTTV